MPASARPLLRDDPADGGENPYDIPLGIGAPAPVLTYAAPPRPRLRAAEEKRVPMSPVHRQMADRLLEAQKNAAGLTVFAETDLCNVMALRNMLKDGPESFGGASSGFLPFFVKACVMALQKHPALNAETDGNDIIYKKYFDIAVTIGTAARHAAPVLRGADKLGLSEIEKKLAALSRRIDDGDLVPGDLAGATFAITNAGLYGAALSTPALHAQQAGVLGLHAVQDKAVVIGGEIKIRPMMNLALSYDARLVCGRDAVAFLNTIRERIEKPESLLAGPENPV